MTKSELTERIIDAITDPYTDCAEDYLDSEPINLTEAKEMLKQIRADERSWGAEPDERLPKEVTPALIKETYNCLIRAKKREARINQIAEFFEDNPDFLVYSYSYLPECHPAAAPNDMCPLDFFTDELAEGGFFFDTNDRTYTKEEILKAFSNSLSSINMNDDYICFHDYGRTFKIITTNEPEDAVDVEEFATAIVDNPDSFKLFVNEIVEEDDLIEKIFKCKKEDLIHE